MDIVAKHVHADKDGVRIAKLNEMTYRRLLWSHRPLTDFWRVGKGYAAKLEGCGLYINQAGTYKVTGTAEGMEGTFECTVTLSPRRFRPE